MKVYPSALRIGDSFTYWHLGNPYPIRVLRLPEEGRDVLDRTLVKVWCKTGEREGWITYGPSALIELDGAEDA